MSTYINVDKNKIIQVIRNLLSNALKFTPRGGRVTISASHIHDSITHKDGSSGGMKQLLRIEVKDTGAGISQVYIYYSYNSL